MLPPVIVDLGPDVGRPQLEIVLDACNEAIAHGVCVPEGSGGEEAPRAMAVARAADRTVRVVRIEVRLSGGDGASFVRELRFSRRDPVSERWRTVGLAIATLVGEGEQRAREEDVEASAPSAVPAPPAEPAEPATPAPQPEPSTPAPAAAPSAAPPATAQPEPEAEEAPEPPPPPPERIERRREREPEVVFEPAEPEPPLDWSHRPLFIGVGAIVGSGFDAGTWRLGGRLRAGWHFESGLAILGSVGYALGSADEPSVAWLTFDAGVGYRFALSERLNVGASVFAGAERARFELPADASSPGSDASQSEALLSPRLGLTGDVWWRAAPMFGFWAALEGSTAGRQTRLFIAPDREPARSLPVALELSAGFGFWLD
jgi:hypothetical protein